MKKSDNYSLSTYIILLGGSTAIITGISEFILNDPFNAFAISIGILMAGILILLIEKYA